MLLYLFPNNLNDSEKTFVAGLLVVLALFLVTSPPITATWNSLYSFTRSFCSVLLWHGGDFIRSLIRKSPYRGRKDGQYEKEMQAWAERMEEEDFHKYGI